MTDRVYIALGLPPQPPTIAELVVFTLAVAFTTCLVLLVLDRT
jgi:hypothetical protein